MEYPDIDYINEIKWLLFRLSYHTRKRKKFNEEITDEMYLLTMEIINILELYKMTNKQTT